MQFPGPGAKPEKMENYVSQPGPENKFLRFTIHLPVWGFIRNVERYVFSRKALRAFFFKGDSFENGNLKRVNMFYVFEKIKIQKKKICAKRKAMFLAFLRHCGSLLFPRHRGMISTMVCKMEVSVTRCV